MEVSSAVLVVVVAVDYNNNMMMVTLASSSTSSSFNSRSHNYGGEYPNLIFCLSFISQKEEEAEEEEEVNVEVEDEGHPCGSILATGDTFACLVSMAY